MRKLLLYIFLILTTIVNAQNLKNQFKFATVYGAINGGTSVSDVDVFSITDGLTTETIQTPYDYNITLGVRKIARFGYENKANTFYDGTEKSWSDAATVGKIRGLEYKFQFDIKRQEGVNYLNQHHFIRYAAHDNCSKVLCVKHFSFKGEYLEDGFADIKYFELSQRYRHRVSNSLSFNAGAVQRIAEPYGYDPLNEWMLSNGSLHYNYLAIQEGYNVNVYENQYTNPSGEIVATSSEVWEELIIPEVLSNYTIKKRKELKSQWNHSLVIGFDYYYYSKEYWLHSWGNLMPYHYDLGDDYSYHNYNNGQWYDYSGGAIFGKKISKQVGVFVEGKYNKYWNREWYDFKLGINYVIR